tara:strand:+ start:11205 stop:11654 length:450 start_codon:yes stop_codon:yes gene_type:complete
MDEKTAHNKYNDILKSVIKEVGNKTTFLQQLNHAGKKIFGVKFRGVFPSDRIPKLNDLSPYCILNLDKSTEPGSHWVSLAKIGKHSIIYDSFGRCHTKIIPQLKYSGNGRVLDTDQDVEQPITATDCGARSLAWLKFLDKYGAENALLI